MGKLTDEIISRLSRIEDKQDQHTSELKVYNIHLEHHIARTRHLEERFEPVEDHVKFVRRLAKILAASFTTIAAVASAVKLFLK